MGTAFARPAKPRPAVSAQAPQVPAYYDGKATHAGPSQAGSIEPDASLTLPPGVMPQSVYPKRAQGKAKVKAQRNAPVKQSNQAARKANQAAKKANKAARKANRATRKANRATRKATETARNGEAKQGTRVGTRKAKQGSGKAQGKRAALRQEFTRHGLRMARLSRIRYLAIQNHNANALARVTALIAKEQARHANWLAQYNGRRTAQSRA
jgi:hypothetical protein